MEDPIEMKYKVNMDLKRYERAIIELSKGTKEQIERSYDLIKQHKLYHHGLKLYQGDKDMTLKIQDALGHYLMNEKNYSMAGLTFEGCGNYLAAI